MLQARTVQKSVLHASAAALSVEGSPRPLYSVIPEADCFKRISLRAPNPKPKILHPNPAPGRRRRRCAYARKRVSPGTQR